ncbi:MAG: hypothetical protein GX936_10670, partial [Clostridiales bacterium]|nr:hypothetical protein [Clostridiales bacterium]
MSMTELKVSFPTEKLDALRFFMDKKQQTVEQELQDYLNKTYEKLVPAQVREYVESRMEQAPARQPEPEQAPAARERPARQTRRQREQAAAESSSAPEAQTEAEGPA